jgi:DNA-binding CsgD family transcriptional regulator
VAYVGWVTAPEAGRSTLTVDLLARGRESYARRAWRDAYDELSASDRHAGLAAADLELLGTAAYLIGRDGAAGEGFERAHHAYLDQEEVPRAVRCAFWRALILLQDGRHAEGGGWLARAQRLVQEAAADCPERGYLLIPSALQALGGGEPDRAYELFGEISEIADRSGDPDLVALSRLGRGQALVKLGQVAPGVAMLDEAMVAVTTGEVSAVAAGIVYCALILACREIFDLRRAQEWTEALSRWCATQQGLRPYRGQCLVHRSELMQLHGEWSDAMEEARTACSHLSETSGNPALGMAQYQRAELLRLRGQFVPAEKAYHQASEWGHPVQPGLALLRLAQGRIDDAAAAIRSAADDAEGDPAQYPRMLAALVETTLAAGDLDAAQAAADDLERLASDFDAAYLRAVAASARGAVVLAAGDARAACVALRRAWLVWQELDAPYDAARVRLMMARACRRIADHDTGDMELDAARRVFERLGAAPALAEAAELARPRTPVARGGLTPREVEVLRLVSTGVTNREVAETLGISEKTVARHLNNIFTTLGVSSRAGATAYAYEHQLVL